MNKVLQSQDLRTSQTLFDFLKYQDYKGYSKVLKTSFDKASKPTATKDLYCVNGFHVIDANPAILEFSDKLPVYLNAYESTSK